MVCKRTLIYRSIPANRQLLGGGTASRVPAGSYQSQGDQRTGSPFPNFNADAWYLNPKVLPVGLFLLWLARSTLGGLVGGGRGRDPRYGYRY